MEKIKLKFIDLFTVENGELVISRTNTALQSLLNFKAKSAALKYNIEIKINKAVKKAIEEFEELRNSLCREHSILKKIINADGLTEETYYIFEPVKDDTKKDNGIIVTLEGGDTKGIIIPQYDIKDMDGFNKEFVELLNTKVELDCYPISLSKLETEKDTSSIDFAALENFIMNDL